MYTVAVISEKGGVGKTTLALDLAVSAIRLGQMAAVLDVDPQATASKWTDRRNSETPWIVPTHAVRLGAAITKAESQGVDLVVIDTPPHSAMDAAEAARRADFVVIPVEPHVFSLDTVVKAADLLKLSGDPQACFVINKAPVQGTEAATAIEYITEHGYKACPVIMHLRAAHRHASNVGQVAAEFDADSKAALESQDFFNYVLKALKKKRG